MIYYKETKIRIPILLYERVEKAKTQKKVGSINSFAIEAFGRLLSVVEKRKPSVKKRKPKN